jgi:hypothetical protein
MTTETAISPQLDGTLLTPGGLSAAEFEVLTQESAIKAKNLTNVIENNKGKYVVVISENSPPFLKYEAWATIAAGYNTAASIADDAELLYDHDGTTIIGAKVHAVVHNIVTGTVTGGAIGYCMFAEKGWGNRTLNQIVSMAGTRAASKALRLMFSWVVVLAGYEPTPYDELDETIIEEMRNRTPAARREPSGNRAETPIKGVVEAGPASGATQDLFCTLHQRNFFKTERMRGYAHPIEGTEPTAWCNMDDVQAPPRPPEPPPQPDGPLIPADADADEIVADTIRLIQEAKDNDQ